MDELEKEKAAEREATQEVKEDEVRSKIVDEFGFDELDDSERIDKLVAREIEHSKKLSSAIGQKIKWREEAAKATPIDSKPQPKPEAVVQPEDVGKVVAQELEKRDLDALEYPDELKTEIQRVAKVQNTSIKAALRDPYIAFKLGEHEKQAKIDEATTTRTNRSGGKNNFSVESPPDVNMATEEGRKTWDEYKQYLIRNGQ